MLKLSKKGLLILLSLAFALAGCSLDDRTYDLEQEVNKLKKELADQKKDRQGEQPSIKLDLPDGKLALDFYPGEMRSVKVNAVGLSEITASCTDPKWSAQYDEETQSLRITASLVVPHDPIKVIVTGADDRGVSYRSVVTCEKLSYDDPASTLILNEGSVWSDPSEMGSLIYISPRLSLADNVYMGVNGRRPGACTQDMVSYDGKLYVIAQNVDASTDGMVLVIDGKTMKHIQHINKVAADKLDWPTHLAVVDEQHIYIRDNKGIWRLDLDSRAFTFVEGTKSARKNVMAVSNGKLYYANFNKLCIIDPKEDKVAEEIDFPAKLSSVIKGPDADHLYLSYADKKTGSIVLFNTKENKVEKTNELTVDQGAKMLGSTFAAAPQISAKGDTIYFSGLKEQVYRHIFSKGETKMMFDTKSINPDHTVVYNTAQVNPVTGLVYMNTLRAFGHLYKTNTTYCLDLRGDEGKLVKRWDNFTRFPAGIFFPYAK